MMKPTLGIIIDTDLIIPPRTGVTYRLVYLSDAIQRSGINVKVFLCNRGIESKRKVKRVFSDFELELHLIPEKSFYDPKLMLEVVHQSRIDILQVEDAVSLLRYYPIARALKLPCCLELHDIEATLIKGLGFSKRDIETTLKITKMACSYADRIICMTPIDKKQVIGRLQVRKAKVSLVPNPVDCEFFPFFGPDVDKQIVLFVGNMFYWPNRDAATYIATYLAARKRMRNVKFVLVGMVPPELVAIGKRTRNVSFTGPVEDLNEMLSAASIAICPVTAGSGMKVKILNYAAAGLPVICTSIGASGFESVRSLIVENDLPKYENHIAGLLSSPAEAVRIGEANRMHVIRHFELEKITAKIVGIYRKILSSPRRTKSILPYSAFAKLPLPLWLKENRVLKQRNRTYYVVRGRTVSVRKE